MSLKWDIATFFIRAKDRTVSKGPNVMSLEKKGP